MGPWFHLSHLPHPSPGVRQCLREGRRTLDPLERLVRSDPRLNTIVKRTFDRSIKGGKKGVHRIVLAGTPDHHVTLRHSPELKYGR
jgi:hypothetical protein